MAIRIPILTNFDSRGLKKAETSLKKFGKFAAVGLAATGAAALAVGAKAIQGAQAAQVATDRLANINESMGLFGKETALVTERLVNYADELERTVAVDADVIKATQAKLLTFKELALSADEVGGNFDRATVAALDLAAAGFGTAETNAVQLGKALNDPIKGITALARSGVTFTETEKERIKTLVESNKLGKAQELVLKAIETQVGGTAEATATTTAKLQFAFNQILDLLGDFLIPLLEIVSNVLIDKVFPAFKQLITYLEPALKKLQPILETVFKRVIEEAPAIWAKLQVAFKLVSQVVMSAVMPVFEGLREAFYTIKSAIDDNAEALKTIAIVIGAAVAIAAPLIGKVLGGAFGILGAVISSVIRVVSAIVTFFSVTLPNAVRTVIGWFKTIGRVIGQVFKPIVNVITTPFRTAFSLIAKLWNNTVGKLEFKVPSWIPGIGGKGFSMPKLPESIPALANGGIVKKPTIALIGEAGAEAVVPLTKRNTPMGAVNNFYINGKVLDPEGTARSINRLLTQSARRAGAY